MNAICALLVLCLPQANEFPDRLAAATGPAQLKALAKWCKENRLESEEQKVKAILDKIKLPARLAGDYSRRAQLRDRRAVARNAAHPT